MNPFLVKTIVQYHVEAAGHGDEKLMALLERMAAPVCSAGNIVKIEDSLDIKRHMAPAFHKHKVAARVGNLGQVNQFAGGEGHGSIFKS